MASGSNIERSPHYGALQDLVDGLFGKGAEGAEEGDTKLVTEGRGAGNVRRHSVKGIDTRRR